MKGAKMELPIKVQGVIYAIQNNQIKYLLIKRREADGGFWQGVTGTLEEGENLKGCLIREIDEELGVNRDSIRQVSNLKQTLQWPKKTGFIITEYVYVVEIDLDSTITLSEEHDDFRWCDFDEAYQTLGKDNNKNTLKLINSELQKLLDNNK